MTKKEKGDRESDESKDKAILSILWYYVQSIYYIHNVMFINVHRYICEFSYIFKSRHISFEI